MIKLKLTAVGNPVAVVLPEEVIARLNVAKGDTLFLTEATSARSTTNAAWTSADFPLTARSVHDLFSGGAVRPQGP